jgi:hypothetical protein
MAIGNNGLAWLIVQLGVRVLRENQGIDKEHSIVMSACSVAMTAAKCELPVTR